MMYTSTSRTDKKMNKIKPKQKKKKEENNKYDIRNH